MVAAHPYPDPEESGAEPDIGEGGAAEPDTDTEARPDSDSGPDTEDTSGFKLEICPPGLTIYSLLVVEMIKESS
jgi:hypothetical protein